MPYATESVISGIAEDCPSECRAAQLSAYEQLPDLAGCACRVAACAAVLGDLAAVMDACGSTTLALPRVSTINGDLYLEAATDGEVFVASAGNTPVALMQTLSAMTAPPPPISLPNGRVTTPSTSMG